MPAPKNGLTYAQAGVDIDAGEALVEAIMPLAKSTARPGADTQLGGFGGLFDLKAAGFTDPLQAGAIVPAARVDEAQAVLTKAGERVTSIDRLVMGKGEPRVRYRGRLNQ